MPPCSSYAKMHRNQHKLSFVLIDGSGGCYFPFHPWFEESRFVFHVISAKSVQLCGPLPSCSACTIFCPQSVRERGSVGCDYVSVHPMITPRDGPQLCPNFDDSSACSFPGFEFETCPRRSPAALLQGGPSHVRRSTRLS